MIMIILNHKIKAKSRILIRTLNNTLNKNHIIHMIFSNFSDKITVNQKIIFSLKNMIIAEKIIFVLIIIIQIIQLRTANTYSIQIKHLQKKIKSNHSFLKHESTLKFKSYVLVILAKTIKLITIFTLLLTTKITN